MRRSCSRSHGVFARWAGDAPNNPGIRGIPPGFDLSAQIRAVLSGNPVVMTSELDEQGLQVAAVSRREPPVLVTLDEVSICSPFPPHLPHLGDCGAHFVGLNDRRLPWEYHGRPATDCVREHWRERRGALYALVGAPRGDRASRGGVPSAGADAARAAPGVGRLRRQR